MRSPHTAMKRKPARNNEDPMQPKINKFIKKRNLSICCLQETHFGARDTHRLKVRWKKIGKEK